MPIVLSSTLPLPNLKLYTSVSVLLVSSCLYYAFNVTSDPNWRLDTNSTLFQSRSGDTLEDLLSIHEELNEKETIIENFNNLQETIMAAIKARNRDEVVDVDALEHGLSEVIQDDEGILSDKRNISNRLRDVTAFMLQEPICIWTLINMAYCCLILLGKTIQKLVFGELRISEQQHMKDKLWNFIFYKFIFLFGVVSVQYLHEVILWVSWFSVLGFLHLLCQLCKDRSEYLTFSPSTPGWSHFRLVGLLSAILALSGAMMAIAFAVGLFSGINTFCFLAAEVVLLAMKTLHVLIRYGIFLYDMRQTGINSESSTWDKRGPVSYYVELSFEIGTLIVDLLHHLHMLLWSNIFLSMASLVIVMQLRYLTNEIQRKIKKHRNYLLVLNHMEKSYPPATAEDLSQNSDNCAICWEKMDSARKLPCSHLFHNSCLQSWLEQDASCPTCRCSLSIHSYSSQTASASPIGLDDGEPMPRNGNNHFFHFNGSRYVSWLPNFSVEVTHINDLLRRESVAQQQNHTSQVRTMARQVQEMFPHIAMQSIINDLQQSHSIEATIDNILEGRLQVQPVAGQFQDMNETESDAAGTSQARTASEYYANPGSIEVGASSLDASPSTSSSSGYEVERSNNIFGNQHDLLREDSRDDVYVRDRFSQYSDERERILQIRKDQLLVNARKRYLERNNSDSIESQPSSSNSFSDNMLRTRFAS